MRLGEADRAADSIYDYLKGRFGPADARSSGYRSGRAFEFEATVVRDLIRRYEGWILDVACGHGLITAPLVAEGRRVFGLDYNQAAVCSSSHKKLIALRGDAFCMPILDGSFGVVLSTEFVQQYDLRQTQRLVGEMARVTRQGGTVILIWRYGTSLMRRLITTGLGIADRVRGRPPLKSFDHSFSSIRDWAAQSQLKVVDSLTVSPLLCLTIQGAESLGSRMLGTSYIAVFRKLR